MIGKSGLVVSEKGDFKEIMCKPKIMPLKSITLERIEEMEVDFRDLPATTLISDP